MQLQTVNCNTSIILKLTFSFTTSFSLLSNIQRTMPHISLSGFATSNANITTRHTPTCGDSITINLYLFIIVCTTLFRKISLTDTRLPSRIESNSDNIGLKSMNSNNKNQQCSSSDLQCVKYGNKHFKKNTHFAIG